MPAGRPRPWGSAELCKVGDLIRETVGFPSDEERGPSVWPHHGTNQEAGCAGSPGVHCAFVCPPAICAVGINHPRRDARWTQACRASGAQGPLHHKPSLTVTTTATWHSAAPTARFHSLPSGTLSPAGQGGHRLTLLLPPPYAQGREGGELRSVWPCVPRRHHERGLRHMRV